MNILRLLTLALSILLIQTANAAEACDRNCVVERVRDYVDALVRHEPDGLPVTEDLRSTQNGKLTQPGEGIWKSITKRGGYQQIFVDDKLDSAVFFGAFEEGDDPLLLAIRFAFEDGKISELEHLVSRPDERNRLIRRHQLSEPNPVYEQILSREQRSSREQLIAAGHAYFDGIEESPEQHKVAMDPHCNRRENGVLLLSNENPDSEPCPIRFQVFNYITEVRDRRVAVVDEARGLVLMYAIFDIPGNVEVAPGPFGPSDLQGNGEPRVDSRKIPRSLYIAELFRVVDGQIRDIEAIMFNEDLGFEAGW